MTPVGQLSFSVAIIIWQTSMGQFYHWSKVSKNFTRLFLNWTAWDLSMCLGRHLYWQLSESIRFLLTALRVNTSVARHVPSTLASKRYQEMQLKTFTYLYWQLSSSKLFSLITICMNNSAFYWANCVPSSCRWSSLQAKSRQTIFIQKAEKLTNRI